AKAVGFSENSTIHLHDSHIHTLDKNSALLYSAVDTTDPTVTITGGSLNAAGDLIRSADGKTNIVFSKVVISPPGSGNAIHFTGTGGEVDLTLNQTALYGNIVAEGGNKAKVTLDSGSTWSFTNNATVTNLKNAGQIVFEPPHDTPSFSTLTTDHYEGDSGKILFYARLEGDDSPANKLIINESSKGTTRVTVRNVGGKGGATKGGIRLIEAKEGTDGTFVQDGPIVAGSYQYSLQKGNQENPNDWYLVSSWFARPESLSYANNLRAANTMFHMTLHERLGETQYTEALSEDSPVPGMWIRASGG
ncbi:autotransporter outer membrane beta-barrel domain-containing protein, partial [Candidatus Williamhamiltonella defendens]|uniref:autotransporter outer membrane beta-barrel domain-containing protein n=1 Tax=Candidatus Williamhamiltonella defendens TaxID=138072 RepID=UPI00158316DA